ncbi:MAG: Rpn family recombination-promoting nuclease/putative transposase, partial [Myxococcota bacterium]
MASHLSSKALHAAHDRLFRHVFSQIEHARGLLRHMLPAALAGRLDWSSLTLVPGSYVDEILKSTASDLLFSIKIRGSKVPVLLYLLLEHQSTQLRLMPLRMLEYCARALRDFVARSGSHRDPLPRI